MTKPGIVNTLQLSPPSQGVILFNGQAWKDWTTIDNLPAPWKVEGEVMGAMFCQDPDLFRYQLLQTAEQAFGL